MLDLFIDTYYLSSVDINLMIDYYGTLENFHYFLEKCKMDVNCFAIQLFMIYGTTNLNIFCINLNLLKCWAPGGGHS